MKLFHFKDDCETIAMVAANTEDEAINILNEYLSYELDVSETECNEIPSERWNELVTFDEYDEETGDSIKIPICELMKGVETPQIIA